MRVRTAMPIIAVCVLLTAWVEGCDAPRSTSNTNHTITTVYPYHGVTPTGGNQP